MVENMEHGLQELTPWLEEARMRQPRAQGPRDLFYQGIMVNLVKFCGHVQCF